MESQSPLPVSGSYFSAILLEASIDFIVWTRTHHQGLIYRMADNFHGMLIFVNFVVQ